MSYKFALPYLSSVFRVDRTNSDGGTTNIPLDPDNTDYAKFLKDWEAGAEVLNPDGTPAPYVAPEPK